MWQYADFDQYRLFNDQQVPGIYKRSFHDLTTEVKSPFQCVSIRISACIRLLKYSCVSRFRYDSRKVAKGVLFNLYRSLNVESQSAVIFTASSLWIA